MSEYPCSICKEPIHCSELDGDGLCWECRESKIERLLNEAEKLKGENGK